MSPNAHQPSLQATPTKEPRHEEQPNGKRVDATDRSEVPRSQRTNLDRSVDHPAGQPSSHHLRRARRRARCRRRLHRHLQNDRSRHGPGWPTCPPHASTTGQVAPTTARNDIRADLQRTTRSSRMVGDPCSVTFTAGPTVTLLATFLALSALWIFPSVRRRIIGETLALRDQNGQVRMLLTADKMGTSSFVIFRSDGDPAVALTASADVGAVSVLGPTGDREAILWYSNGLTALELGVEADRQTTPRVRRVRDG